MLHLVLFDLVNLFGIFWIFRLFGYLAYLFVSVHLDGSSILVGRSLQDNVEVALEGNFPDSDLDGAMLLVRSTMESLRIFYLVMLAAIVGFSFNSEGRGNG